ncbi:MAG: tetratricopeptide repeat protein [Candidatus Omnitrophota bacterium]|nr:tetratricopeptide repeat protein [Candidatus Omnitrophota bacterium]
MNENKSVRLKITFWQRTALIIFGLALSLILLEIALGLGGAVFLYSQERQNENSFKQKGKYRILCLGESTTAALWGQLSYASQLEEILNQSGEKIRFSVINKGIPAINTSIILVQLEDNLNRYKPDMVISMMGINDCGYLYKEPALSVKFLFFYKNLKIYNLFRTLSLNVTARIKEIRRSNTEKPTLAEWSFKKAAQLSTANGDEYAELGFLYQEQGKYIQAEETFKKAIELNPGNYFAYRELGRSYINYGEYPQAEKLFKEFVKLNPNNDRIYQDFIQLYEEMSKHDTM